MRDNKRLRYVGQMFALTLATLCTSCDTHGASRNGASTHVSSRDSAVVRAARPASAKVQDTTLLLDIDRPSNIGYFIPAKDSAEQDEDGYREGVAHVVFGLEDAEKCLGRDRSRMALVIDTAVRIRRGARTDTLRFVFDSLVFGAVFVTPTQEPRVVRGPYPSAMGFYMKEAIPAYFHHAPCSTEQRDTAA